MYVAAACDSPTPLILLSLPQIYGFLRTSPRLPPPIFFKISPKLTKSDHVTRHSPGAQVSGTTRNRISHAGTRGRLTENPVRLTGKTGALTEIPVGVRKSVSRCEICISRRELYVSRRDFYISRREIDFTWCGGKFPQGCRSPCQAARQTQGRHACRRDGRVNKLPAGPRRAHRRT